jgi:hypothetical protein
LAAAAVPSEASSVAEVAGEAPPHAQMPAEIDSAASSGPARRRVLIGTDALLICSLPVNCTVFEPAARGGRLPLGVAAGSAAGGDAGGAGSALAPIVAAAGWRDVRAEGAQREKRDAAAYELSVNGREAPITRPSALSAWTLKLL